MHDAGGAYRINIASFHVWPDHIRNNTHISSVVPVYCRILVSNGCLDLELKQSAIVI
jgi:hypothetical protein